MVITFSVGKSNSEAISQEILLVLAYMLLPLAVELGSGYG